MTKLSPVDVNQLINDYEIARIFYDFTEHCNFPKNITPPVEDLILATKYTKPISEDAYLEIDLINLKSDKAFCLSPNDPNLNGRIIIILRYKGALKETY